MGRLDGKVAIVTGSTSGMGRDTAYVFAEEGAKVIITGRNEQRAKETVDHIKKKGGEASYFSPILLTDHHWTGLWMKLLKNTERLIYYLITLVCLA